MVNSQNYETNFTQTEKLLNILSYILLIFYWIMVLFAFQKLPEQIPTHYNGSGEIDAYGSKNSIFMLPVIASIQFLLFSALIKNPQLLNFKDKESIEKQIENTSKTFLYVKIAILIAFIYIDFKTIEIAINGDNKNGLGIWFLPLFLILISIPIILNILKSKRIKSEKK